MHLGELHKLGLAFGFCNKIGPPKFTISEIIHNKFAYYIIFEQLFHELTELVYQTLQLSQLLPVQTVLVDHELQGRSEFFCL